MPDFDYGVAPLPKSPKGLRKTVVKPNSSTIPTGVTGQPATTAWEVNKYITSAAFQKGQEDYNAMVNEELTRVRRGEINVPAALTAIKTRANDLLKA